MSESNRRLWTAALFATMALAGAALMIRGPIVPELGRNFDAPAWQLGLIAPAGTAGYLVAVTVVGFSAGRLDAHRLIVAGLLGSAVVMLGMGVAPFLAVFLLGMLARGLMNGVLRGLNRPIISHFYPDSRGRMYSYYDMVWAVGAMLGPIGVVAVLALADWRLAYYALAVGMFGLAVVVWWLDGPDVEGTEEPFDRREIAALVRKPEVAAMLVVMMLGTGVEGGLFLWLPTYVGDVLPDGIAGIGLSAAALSSLSLSVMIAGYVPGRFVYGRLSERVGYLRILVGIFLLLIPTFAATFLYAEGLTILLGVVVVGALISGIFPMLVSYATDAVPQHSGPVTALSAISSSLGVGITPAVMGWVISGSDATAAMQLLLVPLVAALAVLLVARVAERKRERAAVSVAD
jgi:MFS family permease